MNFILAALLSLVPAENFELQMGKGTKHWEYVEKSEDLKILNVCKQLFEKNKGHLHKTMGLYNIPKIVHFIWLGPRPFPPESVENIRSWMACHPDWIFKFWTDRERHPPCRGMQVHFIDTFPFQCLKKCYDESKNWGEKSDILRYEILFKEGGVYADHDANALRPFDSLHRGFDFYCCFETPHPPFSGRNVTIGIGLLGSKPNHPVVAAVMKRIGDHWDALSKDFPGSDGYSRTELVLRRTYMPLTQVLMTSADREGNIDIVLPASYFFAKSGLKSIYSKHFYSNTWAHSRGHREEVEQSLQKSVAKLSKKTNQIEWMIGLIGAMNIIGCFFIASRNHGKKTTSARSTSTPFVVSEKRTVEAD